MEIFRDKCSNTFTSHCRCTKKEKERERSPLYGGRHARREIARRAFEGSRARARATTFALNFSPSSTNGVHRVASSRAHESRATRFREMPLARTSVA